MRHIRSWASLALAALLLAACGGGDPDVPGSGSPSGAPTTKGSFASIVSFGTSASDVGTYGPATSLVGGGAPPYFGGKFTTNSATGTVWVENFAASIGLAITPAEIGFGTAPPVKCPAALVNPAFAPTCTGYAQGGARVTDPNGVGHSTGALTVPIVTQIDTHLAANNNTFKDTDLIIVEGGLNDLFVQMQIFGAAAAQIQADAIAGRITADQANAALFSAQTTAQAAMRQAATELAGYVRDKILAKGGKYVAVATIPDLANTPFGNSAPVAPAKSVLTALSQTFNLWLREGLTRQPVQLLDLYDFYNTVVATQGHFGMANVTDAACSPAKIAAITQQQVTTGSSLFCNSTPNVAYNGLKDGADPLTWLFADDVHPSTGGHKLLSDIANQQFKSFGWI